MRVAGRKEGTGHPSWRGSGPCRMHWPERSTAVLESPPRVSLRKRRHGTFLFNKRAIGARHAPEGQTGCERRISMRKYGITLACFLILLVAAIIVACAKPYHEENERYVFVATNINLPYWQEAQAGFLDSARALGVKGELVGPTGYAPNAELGVFRQIVEEHPAGICLSAARPEIFLEYIDKAVAEGIPVICVDSDVPRSKRVLYVGTDNFKAGRESLKQMAALVQHKGSIAVISITGQRNLDDRVAGVADALANFPALKLTKILDDQGDA